jgi:hypothetical protein
MAVTFFGQDDNGNSNMGASANYIYARRFTCHKTGPLVSVALNFHQAYAGDVRLGVYNVSGEAGHLGTLIVDAGVLSGPGTGWQTRNILTPPDVTQGVDYYLVFLPSTDTPANLEFRCQHNLTDPIYYDYYSAQAYGALPSTGPDLSGGEDYAPCMRAGVDDPVVPNALVKQIDE